MEFFEKLGKKASATYKTAAEKTNKLASDTKLKSKINSNKSKIKDIYKEIGKKVYQKYTLGGELDIKDDIENELSRIDELSKEIEDFERQRLELSDVKECINCKEKIEKSSVFCSKCGTKQPEEPVHEVEVVGESDSEGEKEEVEKEEIINEQMEIFEDEDEEEEDKEEN